MPNPINKELAATVLIEAAYTTDEKACEKFGVSIRSLQRWRKALTTDAALAGFVATKKKAFDDAWADQMPKALRKCLEFIERACEQADPRNPAVIESINGAIKIIADAQATGKFIDARIGTPNREAGELPRQSDPPSALIN